MKKVSVVIPAYNKVELTIRTIKSVLSQTYKYIEIIVVDDGSTDNTPSRLRIFGDQITYIRKTNGGACSARNMGIEHSSGEYIALIDCDDIYYPEKIEKSVKRLDSEPDTGFVYTGAFFIDDDDEIISEHKIIDHPPSGWITSSLIISNFICNSTVVVKKECFRKIGNFDESIFIPADWDMWIRLSEKYKAAYIDENLTGYRLTQSYSARNIEQGINEAIYVLDKFYSRNSCITIRLRNESLGKLLFSYGLNYAVINQFALSKSTLIRAIKYRSTSLKTFIFLLGISVAPLLTKKLILLLSPNRQYL